MNGKENPKKNCFDVDLDFKVSRIKPIFSKNCFDDDLDFKVSSIKPIFSHEALSKWLTSYNETSVRMLTY